MQRGMQSAIVAAWLAAGSVSVGAQTASVQQAGAQTPKGRTGLVSVNKYFAYDSSARVAQLTIVASSDTSNLTLNFNGSANGNLEVEVPTGWTLQVRMVNKGLLRHSALVIDAASELPISPKQPVFDGSDIGPIERGLGQNARGTMQFVASRPGSYGIVCGVPAHAQLGMWVLLVVNDDAQAPSYRLLSEALKTVGTTSLPHH